ncbi:hypothetical protein CDL12_13586 [Handroanthus impetiginosus]|uniref:DUF7890 domain-containing protein n=1 Tax=Handroanthus impetiginosus TaxID=429701 RepID=A0A2G9H8E2_9LAMI|nr:hypothetical protein CDL12_13586 [Handroanthus impetiginosus]
MLDFLHSIFPRTEPRYGNELKLKKRVNFESIPLLEIRDEIEEIYSNEEEQYGKKVKILMRKEAARKLLSKCKNGGILEYKDLDQDVGKEKSVCFYSYNAKDD